MPSPSDLSTGVTVDLDLDVYDYLKALSTFEDTVSSVLRRELKLPVPKDPAATDAAEPSGPAVARRTSKSQRSSDGAAADRATKMAQLRRRSAAKGKRSRAAAGTLLPESEYLRPILEVLADNGGSAPKQQVIEELGRRLDSRLTAEDKSPLESGGIRWQSRAQFARLRLADRGLMDKNAPRGVWAITPDGTKALEEEAV